MLQCDAVMNLLILLMYSHISNIFILNQEKMNVCMLSLFLNLDFSFEILF